MSKIVWGEVSHRNAEFGIDHGVFYREISPGEFSEGVFWNGLKSVSETTVGGSIASYHFDGVKYLDKADHKDFEATITAFSVPPGFTSAMGDVSIVPGFILTRQGKTRFGLSYRTMYNDDQYKIHLIYNALTVPTSISYESLTDSPDASEFSFKISAVPPFVEKYVPSPHFIIDSSKMRPDNLYLLEQILYGTEDTTPRLPSIDELFDLVAKWNPLYIIPDPTSGLPQLIHKLGDLYSTSTLGLNRSLIDTRLVSSGFSGLYRLE